MRASVSRVLLSCAFALLLCPARGLAQPATAMLTGIVTAVDGARLPGVALRVLHVQSGKIVDSISSDAGLFRIGGLPPGRYELDASVTGFERRLVGDIVLREGESVSVAVRMELAAVAENVRVVGVAPRDSVEAVGIRESRARDVGEALTVLPGLARVRKGAIANDVVMRGFQGKDVTVLIDGLRVDGACPGHMDPPAFHVDFAEVNRVDVSKGPFDVKNQGGIGGVVNVVTERPQRGWHGSANLTLGSAAALSSSASASMGGQHWAALAGASTRRADAYRDGAGVRLTDRGGYRADAVRDLPAYDVWTGWGRVAYMPRTGTNVQVAYTRQSAGEIVYPYLQMDAIYDRADRVSARVESTALPGGWNTLAAQVYYTGVDHWMTDQLRASGAGKAREYSMGTRAKTAITGGRAEIARGPVSFGLEASRRNWKTSSMMAGQGYTPQFALPDVTMNVAGVFATYATDLSAGWRLESGARIDRATSAADPALANTALYFAYHGTTSTRARDILPAAYARATWRARGWSAVAGIGRSTRLPDQQERFYGVKRMGTDWVGNPSLTPSRNTGLDGELRYSRHGFDAGLATFVYDVADSIRVVNQPRQQMVGGVMNAMARSFVNRDALMRGVEASATVPLARTLFLAGDLSFVRGTYADGNVPEIPPVRVRLRLRYDNARWSGAAEVLGSARQDHVALDLREAPTAASATLNLRAAWRLRRLELAAAIDNVFDTLYSEHLSYQRDPFRSGVRVFEPGRTVSLNASARF